MSATADVIAVMDGLHLAARLYCDREGRASRSVYADDLLCRRYEEARAAVAALGALRDRVARLNPDAGEIGAGMLRTIVAEAREA